MKTIKGIIFILLSLAAIVACEKDGDLITLSGLEENELLATETEVVLSQETDDANVLSMTWNTSTLTVSDPDMSAPDVLKTTLEACKSQDFSDITIGSVEPNLSKTYTGAELNTLAKMLETTPGVATPVYFRLAASVGPNMEPVYSNVLSVNITSYEIDMTAGHILNSDQEDTGFSLYAPDSDGKYTGFMGATAWYNYYLREGDGTTWGNDGVVGTPFILSSEDDVDKRWNCWFPGISGCYYVDFNTIDQEWSSLLIPALSVSGDITGDMTFDRPNVKWTLQFTAASTSMTVKVSGSGKQYNSATGTDDASAIDTPVAFEMDGENIILADIAGDLTITVPSAGEYTLTIDLSNPKGWTIEATSGTVEPPQIIETLYLPGVDDKISGSWTFDNFISLYNEEDSTYAGVVNVDSEWGYTINIEKDNWDDKYTLDAGDGISGTLSFQGPDNIPAPDAGLYLIDVSLSDSTYNLTSVGSQIFVSGLNDVWDFSITLDETATVGTYSGQIEITKVSEYGFQIHMDNTWDHFFGGSDGDLYYKGANITDDASLGLGTYTLTVNLIDKTYTITP